ncbi:MAG: M14 family metallopeptidase [Lachnospiraceae bacterium]
MIKTVARVGLPVDEVLAVNKMRLVPTDRGQREDDLKRISIVTGIHGDELEGQYVCYKLSSYIQEHLECLTGIVDIYPALNPFGIDSITRGIPAFDLDMNRIFPGREDGDMNEYIAAKIMEDIKGSDLSIDIHASNMFLTEVPQIRINEIHRDMLMPFAMEANVDFVWVHGNSTVLESTFAHSLNNLDTPTIVVEMGIGMRITKRYGDQLIDGILHLMEQMGIFKLPQGKEITVRKPIVSTGSNDVCFLNAPASGIFVANVAHDTYVSKGDNIGEIINPLSGRVIADIQAPETGWVFTIREYPTVNEGSLMGRILKEFVYKSEQSLEVEA